MPTYCDVVVTSENDLFIPVFPPEQRLEPNSVLELNLYQGWDSSMRHCVTYTKLADGTEDTTTQSQTVLPDFDSHFTNSGELNLGVASLHLPVGIVGKLNATRDVRIAFDDVRRVRSAGELRLMIADSSQGRVLDNNVYPFDRYRDQVGPDPAKRNSIWILRADEIFVASTIEYHVTISRIGNVGLSAKQVANALSLNVGGQWSGTDDEVIGKRTFKPPVAVGVQGMLFEISTINGRLLSYRRFPTSR